MTMAWMITIDGFQFGFTSQSRFGFGGITIIPKDGYLDDPKYIAAVKKAVNSIPYMDARALIIEMFGSDNDAEYYGMEPDYHPQEKQQALALIMSEGYAFDMDEQLRDAIARMASSKRTHPKVTNKRSPRPGFVYVLQGPDGNYKIGRTIDYRGRIDSLTVKLPFDVHPLMVIRSDDYCALEKMLHDRFADKRVRGEWFALSEQDIQHIQEDFSGDIIDGVLFYE